MSFTVHVEDGYVKVKRRGETICAATETEGKRLSNIEFTDERHRNNKTRQAAMRAYQKAGYR
jgi:hypothetical protein